MAGRLSAPLWRAEHFGMPLLITLDRYAAMLGRSSGAAIRDLVAGAHRWRLWYLIGSAEMRRRFARARLGQLWIMLSGALSVSITGLAFTSVERADSRNVAICCHKHDHLAISWRLSLTTPPRHFRNPASTSSISTCLRLRSFTRFCTRT